MAVPVERRPAPDTENVEGLELDLLLEAAFRLYGYDFRDYARTSIRRRIANIMKQEEVATISATNQEKLREGFAPLLPGFTVVEFDDLEAARAAVT